MKAKIWICTVLMVVMEMAHAKNVVNVNLVDGRRHIDIDASKYSKRDAKRVILDIAGIGNDNLDDYSGEDVKLKRSFDQTKGKHIGLDNPISSRPLTTSIALNTQTSIFFEYCRNTMPLYSYLDDFETDAEATIEDVHRSDYQFLVFTPLNSGVQKLSKKPWQYPIDVDRLERENADEKEISESIQSNMDRFVYEHVVLLNSQDTDHDISHNAEKLLKHNYLKLKTLAGEEIALIHDSTQKSNFYVKTSGSTQKQILIKEYGCFRNGCVFVTDSCLVEF